MTPGLDSVAAPVTDHTGHPVAAVALTVPAEELTGELRESLAATVRRTADEISRRVGHRTR